MEFFLRFNVSQMNLVIKGLETLRDDTTAVHTYVLQQVSSQAQTRSPTAQVTEDTAIGIAKTTSDT